MHGIHATHSFENDGKLFRNKDQSESPTLVSNTSHYFDKFVTIRHHPHAELIGGTT